MVYDIAHSNSAFLILMLELGALTISRVRVPPKYCYYYRCPDHRKNYVMSFAFVFDREQDTYQFSYCYPYSYTRLQNYLDNLEKRNMEYFQRELLCLSVVGGTLRTFPSLSQIVSHVTLPLVC